MSESQVPSFQKRAKILKKAKRIIYTIKPVDLKIGGPSTTPEPYDHNISFLLEMLTFFQNKECVIGD
jgi:hypothetical protein